MTSWPQQDAWPEPARTRELAQRLLQVGLPDEVAELAARAVLFPQDAVIRAVQVYGTVVQYEIDGDFRSCLLLPVQRYRSMGEGGWGQTAPPIPLDEASLHPSLLPVTSYHLRTALQEFQAAEEALLEDAASTNGGGETRLEIRPGLLHLAQPYLSEQHHPRQQPLLLATHGGRLVAAAHRWADLSVWDVLHFCREADYWDKWIAVARADSTLRLHKDHPFKRLPHDRVSRRADAMRSLERARAVGLVVPGRMTLTVCREETAPPRA